MFDISIGESDRRRGGMMLPSMWNAAGITSSEAQVSWLTEERLCCSSLVPFYAVAEIPLSYGYCGSVASREAVRREEAEGRVKVMMSFQDDLRGFPQNGHRLKMSQESQGPRERLRVEHWRKAVRY